MISKKTQGISSDQQCSGSLDVCSPESSVEGRLSDVTNPPSPEESISTEHDEKECDTKKRYYALYDSLDPKDRRDRFVTLCLERHNFVRSTAKAVEAPPVGPITFHFRRRRVYLQVGSSMEPATTKGQLNELLLFALLKKAEGISWSGLWAYAFQRRSADNRIVRMNAEIKSEVSEVARTLGLCITQVTDD